MTTAQKTKSKDSDAQDKAEEQINYGGRDHQPDGDVNPADAIHVDDGEKGKPAATEHHNAQQRKEKKLP